MRSATITTGPATNLVETDTSTRFLPNRLVDYARLLIDSPHPDVAGTWPRVSAVLGRQALEITLSRFWLVAEPGVEDASMRAQLLCLSEYLAPRLVTRVRYAWHGFSAACHHHAYELPPMSTEIKGWLNDVDAFIKTCDAVVAKQTPPSRNC
ncbi:MAG: hypothetical protein OXI96_08925 [Acidimicrobiaceae bacterium]|nr:hypothetical protein [Acidimicrobiaceae bacterium]